jgi:hypothetical protein
MSGDRLRDEDLFEGDRDRYQGDSTADNEGYPADSRAASDGYHPETADPSDGVDRLEGADRADAGGPSDHAEQFDEGLRPLIEQWKSMRQGWWNQAGYETFWDLVKEEEAGWQRMGFRSIFDKRRKRPKSRELPDPTPPQIDLDALANDATRPRRPRERQVNVRLTQLGYDALCRAARAYGLRPTTFARLLIHRGALAVLEELKSEPRAGSR